MYRQVQTNPTTFQTPATIVEVEGRHSGSMIWTERINFGNMLVAYALLNPNITSSSNQAKSFTKSTLEKYINHKSNFYLYHGIKNADFV